MTLFSVDLTTRRIERLVGVTGCGECRTSAAPADPDEMTVVMGEPNTAAQARARCVLWLCGQCRGVECRCVQLATPPPPRRSDGHPGRG